MLHLQQSLGTADGEGKPELARRSMRHAKKNAGTKPAFSR
jgi:hypothetical protein